MTKKNYNSAAVPVFVADIVPRKNLMVFGVFFSTESENLGALK